MSQSLARMIASFFYTGFLRPASGTWGSLAALVAGVGLHMLGGPILIFVGAIMAYFIGLRATEIYTRSLDNHDPSQVVIDEVVGMWIALLPVSIGAKMMNAPIDALYPGIISAFIAFRLFDILKPGPIGAADRLHTAKGVMLDDVYAGVAAAVTVCILAAIAHGLMR